MANANTQPAALLLGPKNIRLGEAPAPNAPGPGEALMTDVGFTGGGAGAGMVYLAGKQSHKLSNDQMIEHIVEQVEKKAAEIEATMAPEAAE